MTDVAQLHDAPVPTKDDLEFVCDMARFAEGIADEAAIRKKYRLSEAVWTQLADDDELVRAIDAEKIRRVRTGQLKREKAQQLVVKGPAILDAIASDSNASPRHRVDAIKTLDTMAANGPAGSPAADPTRFIIRIDLSGDSGREHVETYNKSILPDPHDIDLGADDDVGAGTSKLSRPATIDAGDAEHNADDTAGLVAAFAMRKKMQGGNSGQPL